MGKAYNLMKKEEGRPKKRFQSDTVSVGRTREQVAHKDGVSNATVARNGQFAAAVDKLAAHVPALAEQIKGGRCRITKAEVIAANGQR